MSENQLTTLSYMCCRFVWLAYLQIENTCKCISRKDAKAIVAEDPVIRFFSDVSLCESQQQKVKTVKMALVNFLAYIESRN